MKILEEIIHLPNVSGDEIELKNYLKKHWEALNYEVNSDRLGSFIASKKEGGTIRVMLSTNIDDVGFMISERVSEDLYKIIPVGPMNSELYMGKFAHIINRTHHSIPCIIIKREEILYVATQTREPILPGDRVAVTEDTQIISNDWILVSNTSRKILWEIISKIEVDNSSITPYIVGVAQSVVGQRGSITSVNTVEPDIALLLDVAPIKNYKENSLYVRVMDKGMISNTALLKQVEELADKMEINMEYEYSTTINDGSLVHKSGSGTPSITLILPFIQDAGLNAIVSKKDMNTLVKFINTFLNSLDEDKVKDINYGEGLKHEG